jgi:hypothetical protein
MTLPEAALAAGQLERLIAALADRLDEEHDDIEDVGGAVLAGAV